MFRVFGKFLNRLGNFGGVFIREDGCFFILLTILNLPIFIQAFFYNHRVIPLAEGFSDGLPGFWRGTFFILMLCLALNILFSRLPRVKIFLQAVLITLFTIFFVTDIFLLNRFDNVLHVDMIQIVMGTNPLTAKQFISDYVLTFPIIVGIIFLVATIAAMSKALKKFFVTRSEERLRRFSFDLLIIFLPMILLYGYTIFYAVFLQTKFAFKETTFGRNLFNCIAVFDSAGNEPKILAEMDEQLETEKILADNSSVPHVVFILGESTTRNHMSLYSYRLPTTPLLDSRYKRGELFRFNDTISCANYTSAAMEKIFTFAEKDTPDWYLSANIFDILRRTDYHTFWLSNQSPLGLWGNLDRIYASRCDEEFFIESKENFSYRREFDGVLLPALDNFLARAQDKNFLVIHIYGTHAAYNERYPADFAKFTATDEDKPTDAGRKIAAAYDNAVLYNDFIINEIIKRFEDKDAAIIYISDHGEEIFEDGREFSGHSPEDRGNRSMIEIPALIWLSQKFRESHPEKISALAAAVDKPYRTDFFIHALLELLDIRTTSFDPTKSILNADFDSTRPRIYNGEPYVK